MKLEIITSLNAPLPGGSYSQAVKAGDWLYISGQLPIYGRSGKVELGDIARQTELVFKNVLEILKVAGGSFTNLVKTTLYIANMEQFQEINAAYEKIMDGAKPARACVEVARIPRDVGIEADAVAYLG